MNSLTYFENPGTPTYPMTPSPMTIASAPAISVRTCINERQPDLAPACIEVTRSPAAIGFGCWGWRWKICRYHGTFAAATTCAVTRLVPHRRQNFRVASLASPQLAQMRSPGCATRRSAVATGFGRAATWSVGRRAAGWASAGCRAAAAAAGPTASGRLTGGCCVPARGGRAAGSTGACVAAAAPGPTGPGPAGRTGGGGGGGAPTRLAEGAAEELDETRPGCGKLGLGAGVEAAAAVAAAARPRVLDFDFDGPPRRAIGGAGGVGAGVGSGSAACSAPAGSGSGTAASAAASTAREVESVRDGPPRRTIGAAGGAGSGSIEVSASSRTSGSAAKAAAAAMTGSGSGSGSRRPARAPARGCELGLAARAPPYDGLRFRLR